VSTKQALQELARQVRGDTLQILSAAESTWLTFAPQGTSNHILWHAGHALWLQDVLCIELLTGTSELPPGWAEMFGMECRPVQQTTHWPSRENAIERLQQQLRRIIELLESFSDETLRTIANPARGAATAADRITHGFHDEAKHCGEMYLLLKLCRAGHAR